MKAMYITLIGVLLSLIMAEPTAAQAFRNAGFAGAQFLKIGVGARAMGMGGAYTSADGDATTLAWNPAGIGTIRAIQLSAEHNAWVADIPHSFIGLVVPVTEQFNLGLHTIYLTSGKIEITTIDRPEGTGEYYQASDLAVGLTSSVRLTSQLTFATTVKYVETRIHDVQSSGLALDAGAWYATGFRGLNLGFSVSNLGFDQAFSGRSLEVRYDPPAPGEPPLKAQLQTLDFPVPLMFRASGAFDLFEMFLQSYEHHRLLVAMDFIQHSDTPERFVLGAEYTWQRLVSLRGGYIFNADELGWNAGVGARLTVSEFTIGADYAASALGRFGIGHRVGISIFYH